MGHQPKHHKDERAASLLKEFAAEYFERESNHDSLITITNSQILDRGKRAMIYFTALPQHKEEAALDFMRRHRSEFRQFVISKKSFGYAPRIDFQIDMGEHNRQRIDELLNQNQIEN